MGRHYIPNLMKYLCLCMLGVFVLDLMPFSVSASALLYFDRALILRGQLWRLVTFVFLPTSNSLLFIFLSLYFYYLMGNMLENHWGSRKFNLYYLIGVLGNIAAGFLTGYATNTFLNMTLFLAVAVLYGDMKVNLFMAFPIRMKYLALVDAALLLFQFLSGSWIIKVSLVFSMLPFILFFGQDAKRVWHHEMWKLKNWWAEHKR